MSDLEMTPKAFAIWMSVLAAYFAGAFSLTFAAITYNANFTLHSAQLIRAPQPAVRVDITFKKLPHGRADDADLGIWGPEGPPYHMQEVKWAALAEMDDDPRTTPGIPPAPGTRSVFVVPLDAENQRRLSRLTAGDPYEVQFHWGYSRYTRIDVD
jgi:hypothetical protein